MVEGKGEGRGRGKDGVVKRGLFPTEALVNAPEAKMRTYFDKTEYYSCYN